MMRLLLVTALLAAPAPERILLLQDAAPPRLERQVVHRQLLHTLMADPRVELLAEAPLPAALERAVTLGAVARAQLDGARSELQALRPREAAAHAAAATQRFHRVATLTGDVAPLAQSLEIEAAAYLLLGAQEPASRALRQLVALDPGWRPEGALYNPAMQAAVARARVALEHAPTVLCTIQAAGAQDALFIDGRFAGFGSVTRELTRHVAHILWAVPRHGEPAGRHLPAAPQQRAPVQLDMPSWPQGPSLAAGTPLQRLVEATRLPGTALDPDAAALRGRRVRRVLVLADVDGGLALTSFDLHAGSRACQLTPAAIADAWDVRRAAQALLADVPPAAAPAP